MTLFASTLKISTVVCTLCCFSSVAIADNILKDVATKPITNAKEAAASVEKAQEDVADEAEEILDADYSEDPADMGDYTDEEILDEEIGEDEEVEGTPDSTAVPVTPSTTQLPAKSPAPVN